MKKSTFPLALATTAALLLLLGGCTAEPEAEDVATLGTPAATAAPDAGASVRAADDPMRQRLDMTAEENDAMWQTYSDCMTENGSPLKAFPQPSEEAQAKALAACDSKMPLPAWEYDPNNPDSRDFVERVVQCLRDGGVEFAEADGLSIALGGPDNDSASISLGMEILPDCEVEMSAK